MQLKFSTFPLTFLILILTSIALGSSHKIHHDEENDQDEYKYPCPIKWKPYHLDDEPFRYGIKSGIYQPDDQAFIGRGNIKNTVTFGRIKVDGKPGFYTQMGGENSFNDDPNQIWYLAKNQDCKYSWADADDESQRKFVIDAGSDEIGIRVVIPRYSQMPPMKGGLFYGDDAYASLKIRNITYQYMTCRSKNPIISPKQKYNSPLYPPTILRSDDSGCKHTWKFYKNNNDPFQDGLNAGLFGDNNPAFVGMTKVGKFWRPSRIQTKSPVGAFVLDDLKEKFASNFSYYLVDNPKYKYYWVDAVGNEFIKNSVAVSQDSGPFRFPIGKAVINGKTIIGLTDGMGGLIYPDENGNQHVVGQYQVLACDPVPKYECAQIWKPYKFDNAPSIDGFLIGNYQGNIQSFIGRTIIPQNTQHSIGRIQFSPKSEAGLYYFNSNTGIEAKDKSSSVEYLVRNKDDTYQWISSSSGKSVENAIKNQENGEFAVGKIQFDDKIYIGAVKAGKGLIFTDFRGKKQVSVNYEVLTCFSPVSSE